jgi:DNA processing protein
MVEQEVLCNIWLTTVFGYASEKPIELIDRFGSAYNVFENGFDELNFGDASDEIRYAFQNKDLSYAKYILERTLKDGAKTVCLGEDDYPELLAEIPNPPLVLYYIGDISCFSSKLPFTVVGTRKTDEEGRKILSDFLPPLQQAGFQIVSGFAEGAEAYIHRHAEKTAAVLPNGLNVLYPASNAGLKEEIVEKGGVVLTEFVSDVRAYRGNFYLRNRLLAGLSCGVLVTQAREKSGTSITATAAGDYGRQVYAVPGSIYNPRFKGCIEMIRQGAIAVSDPSQIIADYAAIYDEITDLSEQNSVVCGIADLSNEKYADLSENERKVIAAISGNRLHADEITEKTGLDISAVNAALVVLELESLIARLDGNQYIII